ncbi:MAG: ethylbenzene dehydrogenase, partial [Candidatus Dadabacteria bacterium]
MSAEGAAAHTSAPAVPAPYGDWRDVYRQKWTWDRIAKSSHFTNCWYQSHCAWNVYVKDGLVWREEQVAGYPQTRPEVPDFNPRGCQKGACYSERMYDPARVTYPLKRVGPRGSGKWRRVRWDEALDDLAGEFVRVVTEEGPDRVFWDNGPLFTFGAMAAAQARFSYLAGTVSLDMNTEIGDGHRGAGETFGKIVFERSADDYFYSDLILIWGANPMATQIPNAHFMYEARYNGTQVVTIAPDYSPSSIHSDLWIPVKPGCDAALALAVARILIDEGRFDRGFIVEQTDLPLLVREDTGRLLRKSDFEDGGDDEIFYWFDRRKGTVAEVPRTDLRLGGADPALEGSYEVETRAGKVTVRPVFERLRERLKQYTPERASKICGTPPRLIRELADRMASAKAATNVTTSNFSKYYHGNLIERSQALLFALCGHIGKKGGGFVAFPFLTNDGFDEFAISRTGLLDTAKLWANILPKRTLLGWKGYTDEMTTYELSRDSYRDGLIFTCGVLFWAVHGGLLEYSGRTHEWDPYLKRSLKEYLDESLEKGWQYVRPAPGKDPRMMFTLGSNILRRIRAYPLLLKHLWPKLTRIAVLDWRMTSTGMFADYVLPISAWYERNDHKWGTPLMPFLHGGTKATRTGEAMHEWTLIHELTRKISEIARARGVDEYTDDMGRTHSLQNLHREFTYDGKFGRDAEGEVAADLIA